jgi:hypothetical protein
MSEAYVVKQYCYAAFVRNNVTSHRNHVSNFDVPATARYSTSKIEIEPIWRLTRGCRSDGRLKSTTNNRIRGKLTHLHHVMHSSLFAPLSLYANLLGIHPLASRHQQSYLSYSYRAFATVSKV